MAEKRSSSWILPLAVGAVAIAVLVLAVVPVIAIVSGSGPFGEEPEQTPFVTDEDEVTVEIRDFVYFPEDLTVDAGATVTWMNDESAPHDATADDESWRTDVLNEDESGSITFDETGTFAYYCSIHPFMEGTVTVR